MMNLTVRKNTNAPKTKKGKKYDQYELIFAEKPTEEVKSRLNHTLFQHINATKWVMKVTKTSTEEYVRTLITDFIEDMGDAIEVHYCASWDRAVEPTTEAEIAG